MKPCRAWATRFVATVEVLPTGAGQPLAPVPTKPHRNWWLWALIPAVLVSSFALLLLLAKRAGTPAATPLHRPSVAIMGFRNLTAKPDQNWLSTALSEMLATELAAGEHVRVISGRKRGPHQARIGAAGRGKLLGEDAYQDLAQLAGADYVLVGSYLNSGAQFRSVRLDLRLQDSKTGEIAGDVAGETAAKTIWADWWHRRARLCVRGSPSRPPTRPEVSGALSP